MSNTLIHYSGCGAERPPETLVTFGRQQLCPKCLEARTLVCACCGERIHREDNFRTAAELLCQNCYDSRYTNCENCGALIRMEDARYGPDDQDGDEPYCAGCFSFAHHHGNINDYYYKPTPIFYGDGPRYFGVELEIDGAREDGISAGRLLEIANDGAQRVYCKHDGSLEDGFEIVTPL